MRNIKMTIEYDGTRYQGWQRLGNTDKTIQGKIENIIKQLTGETIEIIGSGRTDAGTHARNQVANFKTEYTGSLAEMLSFFHKYLPQDIVVKHLEEVPDRFHARYNAKGKTYSYYLWNDPIPSAFKRHYSYHYPETLNLDAMQQAADLLCGTHDFAGFSALKKSKKSTVRTIEAIKITREGHELHFTFKGNGFLHKMVRILVGTLVEIGSGQMKIKQIETIFEQKIRSEAGETMPAQGLFLDYVEYE